MMESFEPKKLALIRIWQILKEYSDDAHPLTQEDISRRLERDYGIIIERKAISRNLSLLKEAGAEIESCRAGSYLACRSFEDAELRLLIDSVLSSKHITAKHSKELIDRLCGLSSRYFRASVKHIRSVDHWGKTENQSLFYNIEVIDTAIEESRQVHYDYNKYGTDKRLHKSSHQYVSPYQMLLHNQHYYLMAYSEYWKHMVFHRLDRMTNTKLTGKQATPIKSIPGFENGIDYNELSSAMPYMYTDQPERIELIADRSIVDQIVDWFGSAAQFTRSERQGKVTVQLRASPQAMAHWAMQYIHHVEILRPESLRVQIRQALEAGLEAYKK